jgi:hypothetical protein
MAAPFVATSRLSNIIQMITLSRQTGILRVIRGQGATRELGQVRFLDGEPVAALLGPLTGGAALGVLSNWGECQYAFDEISMREAADPTMAAPDWMGPRPSPAPGSMPGAYPGSMPGAYPGSMPGAYPGSMPGLRSPTTPFSGSSWPVYGYQQPAQQAPPYAVPPSGPLADLADLAASVSQGVPYGSSPPPAYSQPSLGVFGPGPGTGTAQRGHSTGAYGGGQPAVATGLLNVIPQRTMLAEQIDQLPLDRRERMVLLLVDGQRTVADLARLTRRTEQELQAVLIHLELLGLVQLRR